MSNKKTSLHTPEQNPHIRSGESADTEHIRQKADYVSTKHIKTANPGDTMHDRPEENHVRITNPGSVNTKEVSTAAPQQETRPEESHAQITSQGSVNTTGISTAEPQQGTQEAQRIRVSGTKSDSVHVRQTSPGTHINQQTSPGVHIKQTDAADTTTHVRSTEAGSATPGQMQPHQTVGHNHPAGNTADMPAQTNVVAAQIATDDTAAQNGTILPAQQNGGAHPYTGNGTHIATNRDPAAHVRSAGIRPDIKPADFNQNKTKITHTRTGRQDIAVNATADVSNHNSPVSVQKHTPGSAYQAVTPVNKNIDTQVTHAGTADVSSIVVQTEPASLPKGIVTDEMNTERDTIPAVQKVNHQTQPEEPDMMRAHVRRVKTDATKDAAQTTGKIKTKNPEDRIKQKNVSLKRADKKRRALPVLGKLFKQKQEQTDGASIVAIDKDPGKLPVGRRGRSLGVPLLAFFLSASLAFGGYNVSETRAKLATAGYQAYDVTDTSSPNLTTVAASMIQTRLDAYQSKIMYGRSNASGVWTGGIDPGNGDTSGSVSGAVDLSNHDNWYTYDHTLAEFLATLQEVADEARNGGWIYGDSHGAWPGDDGQNSCDGLIDRALLKMGVSYRPAGRRLVVSDIPLYFPNLGFSVITDPDDHMPGDVPVFIPIQGAANQSWHTFVVESVNADGTINKYDFGMTERMQRVQPMQAPFDEWPERVFYCTLRGNWKDSAIASGTGTGTALPIQGTGSVDLPPQEDLIAVPCRNATMDGTPISTSFDGGVARYTQRHTYNADAVYIYHDRVVVTEEDERYETAEVAENGEHYVIVDRTENVKHDITEDIRVKDTSVTLKYTDKDGNDAYITDLVYTKDGQILYNEEAYIKAIIGSTTVRSKNEELEPEKYLKHVAALVDASLKAAGGYDVELTTYETGQKRMWSLAEHEGTATANEVAIRAAVTINVDCNLTEILKKDTSHWWSRDEQEKAMNYYVMDYPLFLMFHRIELASGDSGGLTGEAAEIYQYLSEAGLDDVHIAAILGNFQQESGLNPDTVQGSRWNASDFATIAYDGSPGGVNGPKGASRGYGLAQWTRGRANALQSFADTKHKSWRDLQTQVEYFIREYKSNTTGSPWLRGAVSRANFLAASDVDTATKIFFDDFEQPGDSTLPIRQRYAREFLAQIMAGGADTEAYMRWAEKIAADNSHGYSQSSRTGNPDYDCSSFVAAALKAAGYDVGEGYFTTATEPMALRKAGFTEMEYKEGSLERGDILWIRNGTRNHTEFYCGNGKTIGAHSSYGDTTPGDQSGNEISAIENNNNWTKIFRAPVSASSDDADLSLEADVKFNTYGTVGGVKCVINGISNVGQGANAFAVDIIYGGGTIGSRDHCYAYAEGIWGSASTPGPVGKNYQYYNQDKNYEHPGNWYNNWVKLKVCWWKNGTFRGYINNKQIFEDHANMTPQIVNIESTVISNGARIDAEFRNIRVKYAVNGRYGTRGNWQTMGWFGLSSQLKSSGRTIGGNTGYCTNGQPTHGVSAVMGGTATGADGMDWDTTMKYTGKPLSSYFQIGLNT